MTPTELFLQNMLAYPGAPVGPSSGTGYPAGGVPLSVPPPSPQVGESPMATVPPVPVIRRPGYMLPPGLGGPQMPTQSVPSSSGLMNPMARFAMGLASGVNAHRPGMSRGGAFASGFANGLAGSFAYDMQAQEIAERQRRQAEVDRRQADQDQLTRDELTYRRGRDTLGDQRWDMERRDRRSDARENQRYRERYLDAQTQRRSGMSQSLRDEDAIRQNYLRSFMEPHRSRLAGLTQPERDRLWQQAQDYAERMIQDRRRRLRTPTPDQSSPDGPDDDGGVFNPNE